VRRGGGQILFVGIVTNLTLTQIVEFQVILTMIVDRNPKILVIVIVGVHHRAVFQQVVTIVQIAMKHVRLMFLIPIIIVRLHKFQLGDMMRMKVVTILVVMQISLVVTVMTITKKTNTVENQ
jgi:hypothetical protein